MTDITPTSTSRIFSRWISASAVVAASFIGAVGCEDDGDPNAPCEGPQCVEADATDGSEDATPDTDTSDTDDATPDIDEDVAPDIDEDGTPDADAVDGPNVPDSYAFESNFNQGESSVSYGGQIYRQVRIGEMKSTIGGLAAAVASESPENEQAILDDLMAVYADGDAVSDLEALPIVTSPATLQSTYGDLASQRNLQSKVAGQGTEPSSSFRDWSTEFAGWEDDSIDPNGGTIATPDDLIQAFLARAASEAWDHATATDRPDPTDESATPAERPVFVTEEGQDLAQLTAKLMLCSINFSQAADDYLDDDDPTGQKGLYGDNTSGDPYSSLEHHWDEGFGYFGAAADYGDYTDDEIRNDVYMDSNADNAIDLTSEYNFGASVNAAKRDAGSVGTTGATDLTAEAFDAFLNGRALISYAQEDGDGELTADELNELQGYRDQAIGAWEAAYAATVIHYINDVLADLDAYGSESFSFADLAKHWSEAKGFALCFQFNPRSAVSDADFTSLHASLGDAPVLPNADAQDVADYRDGLVNARNMLRDAYGFANDTVEGW